MRKTILSSMASLLLPFVAYGTPSNYGGYQRKLVVGKLNESVLSSAQGASREDMSSSVVNAEDLTVLHGTETRELVLVDADIRDKHLILKQARPGMDIVEVNLSDNGVSALVQALKGYRDLHAVHIVAHAEAGVMYLGGNRIDKQTLLENLPGFAAINQAVREGGDLMLYGCDLALGMAGDEFLTILRQHTHVDVAASLDKTGNANLGGDWDLEVRKGNIEAQPLPGSLALKDFSTILAVPAGVKDFSSGWTDDGNTLSSTHFLLGARDTNSTNSLDAAIYAGAPNPVYIQNGESANSYFYVNADGVNTGTFELTALTAGEYLTGQFSNIYIVGVLPDNSTITSSTINGTAATYETFSFGSGELTGFSGVQLKAFKLYFDSDNGVNDVPFFEFRNFTTGTSFDPPNNDADLTAAAGVTEPVGLGTTVDAAGEAVDVFDFTISDGGTSDGLATTVSQIVVNVSGTSSDAERGQITWRLNGSGVSNVTGTYDAGSDTITFSGLGISVADGGNATYTVNAYFNDNTNLTENRTIILSVDGDTDLTVGANSTQMGSTSPVTNGAGTTIDVVATQLVFTIQPAGSVSGSALSTQPVVAARDAYGNTDVDFTETITLTEASAGSLTNNTQAATAGVATFTSLTYTASADQESFTLTANDQDGVGTDLPTVDANAVTSDVVATALIFSTQPAPILLTSGQLTSFTTVPVVSAVDSDGVVDTGYSTDITLTEANGAGSTAMNATGDTDLNGESVSITPSSGVATYSSMQIQYTASGSADETFNLRATSGGLTQVDSTQLTATVIPTITSVGVPANGTYMAGQTLDFTVNASENITVNTTGGTPQIALTVGAATRQAAYVSGSGTSALVFRYTVQAGDSDTDGIAVGTLSANGGTLQDGSGNALDTTLNSVGSTTGVLVDAIAPSVSSVSVPANGTYSTGQNLDFTINIDENVTVNTTGGTPRIALTIGATTRYPTYQGGSGSSALLFRYTVQAGDEDTNGIAVAASVDPNGGSLRDSAGNDLNPPLNSVGATTSILVDTAPPSGHSVSFDDGDLNNSEATSTSFTFAGAEVGADYSYTVSSSGGGANVTGTGTIATTTDQISGIDVSGLGDGTLTLSVTLTDPAGNAASAVTDTASLDASAPSGHSASFDDGTLNSTEASSTSFTFAGAEVGADYSYTISSSGGGTPVTGTGTIASAGQQISGINVSGLSDGTLTLSVTLTDTAGNAASAVTDTATLDNAPPSGHSVSFDDDTVNGTEATSTSFTFAGAEVGADYSYTISSSGGGTPATGTGTIASVGQQISGINVSGLSDGTLTVSVTLTDTAGNSANAVTDTANLDASAPSGHSVSFDDDTLNGTEATGISFTFADAEVGADYSYTISSSGGGTNVTGTGTIATATDQISGIDVSGLGDGTLTLSVTLTDPAGNAASAVTDTATLDSAPPSGHSVSFDQTDVNNGNHTAISYTFTAAEVGADYSYTISSSAGGTPVTGSGTVASAGQTISGLDVSGLNDGTLTLSVTLTDTAGNAATAVTDTISKDANAPAVDTVAVTDGDFAEGDTVTVMVTLTEDVTVAGGSPTLNIDIGPTARQATMTGEAGGVLTFSYTVQASDNTDGTGVTVRASSIDLTGGITVRDAGGNDADLTFNQVSNANAQVDTVLPVDPVVTDPASAISVNTPDYELAGTHGEDDVVINLYADDDNDGVADNTTVLVSTSVSGGAWAVTHTLTANSDNNFVVVAEDAAGNVSAAVDVPTITHDNVAPAAPAAPDLEAASDSGTSDTDDLTNAIAPDISGTAEANATVTLSSDIDGEVGTATADGSGEWILTTSDLSEGVHSLTAIATDAAGNDSAASAALTVTLDTTGPSLSALADQRLALGDSTGALAFTLGDNVSDPANVTLTPASSDTAVVPLGNILLGGSDGNRTVEITGAAFGVSSVDIETVDEAGNTSTETLQVRINTPPAISGSGAETLEAGTSYSFTPSASDVDGDTLTFSISNRPSWASFNTSTGRLSGTPPSSGSFSGITISVSDGLASTALGPFTITVSTAANTPPVISGTPSTQVTVGQHYHFAPSATDADGDSLSFSASDVPAWLLFDAATGSVSGMPGDAQVGTHSNIVISVSDGTDSAALGAFSITVAAGEDSDDDGVSDYQEGLDETDPNDPDDYVDTAAPQLTAPAPQVLNAEGLFTAVSLRQLLGLEADADEAALTAALTALSQDRVDGDGCCTPVVQGMSEGRIRLRPGRQLVTWATTDRKGNEALAEQTVDVRPLVSFGMDRQVGEGGTAIIPVLLNGPAPVYPFTVPYVIGPASTADAADHNLTSGSVTFTETEGVPEVRTDIVVDTFLDETTEGDETVLLRLDNSSGSEPPAPDAAPDSHNINVGRGEFQLTISEDNLAPQAQLRLWQAEMTTVQVVQTGGEVRVAATVSDPNPLDSPTLSWMGTDTALLDLAEEGDTQLTFDPAALAVGTYRVRALATDSTDASGSAVLDFVVLSAPPPLSEDEDSDGDGLSDAEEGNTDSNGNGIPDYLDPGYASNVLPLQVSEPDGHLAECEPGTDCRLGRAALTGDGGGILMSVEMLTAQSIDEDPAFEPVGGLFDFKIDGLPAAGLSAQIVLPLTEAIPAEAVYRKYLDGEWVDFTEDSRNSLASAPGEPGYCTSLTLPVWEAGLIEGYHCVRLQIEDGGPNDADGEANSAIADPGAVSIAREDDGDGDGGGNGGGNGGGGNGGGSPSGGSSGGGGAIGAWWLPLLLAGWLRRRRITDHRFIDHRVDDR